MAREYRYSEHRCELPTSSENDFLQMPPYLSRYMRWCRSLRKFCGVDENSHRTKDFFRSIAAVRAEKRRHDSDYLLTIHPFSKFTVFRERFLLLIWVFNFVIDPLIWCFHTVIGFQLHLYLHYPQDVMNILLLFNVLVTGFIGYIDKSTKEVILCPKRIFRHMVFRYIIPELLGCLPFYVIVIDVLDYDPQTSRLPSIVASIHILRLLRLPDFLRYLNNLFREMGFREGINIWFVMFVMNFYVIFWCSIFLFFTNVLIYTYNELPKDSFLRDGLASNSTSGRVIMKPYNSFSCTLITTITIAACHFYGATGGYLAVETTLEKILCSIIVIFGYICCTFVTAKLLESYGSSNIATTKYDEFMQQVSKYAISKKMPTKLTKRLDMYLEYKFNKRYFREEFILSTLTEHLRNEVTIYGCRNVLEKILLFQELPKGVVGSILGYLKREIYLPNDVVVKYGDPLIKMYLVSFGTLSGYYGPEVIEILHFQDGDHFGERSLSGKAVTAILTVVSLEITEIYTLTRDDVKHCSAFLREMNEIVLKVSNKRNKLYKQLAEMVGEEGSPSSVFEDIRKGRILERERLRDV